MKTIKRQRMAEEDAAIVVVPVPFAEYYRCDEPTEDNYRAAGYVPADSALAHVRDLEGQIVEATQAADRLMNELTAADSRHTTALAQCARVEQHHHEIISYIASSANGTGGGCSNVSADESRATDAVWELVGRLDSARKRASEAERERDEAEAKIDVLTETAARVIVERDALRTRISTYERVVEAANRMQAGDRSDALNEALAAITTAPAAELERIGRECDKLIKPLLPAPAKPDTCGECKDFNGSLMCLRFISNTVSDAKACPDGTRRLPVVQPARTCGECLSLTRAGACWDKGSMRYGETRDEAEPACPSFVGREG